MEGVRQRHQFGTQGVAGMIDAYLADLREQLRIPSEQILAEVEDHLREGAERHGEEAAVARFGPVALVADRFHRDVAVRDARRAVRAVVLAGAVLFVLFIAVDFMQPRAPWPDRMMPLGLEWKLHVALLAGQVALVAGVIALIHHVLGHRLETLRAGLVAVGAATVAVGFHLVFQIDRLSWVQHTRSFAVVVVASAVARVVVLVVAAVLVLRGTRRVERIEVTSVNGLLLRRGWIWCVAVALLAGVAVFAHDEATRARSLVDGGLEATTAVAAFAFLRSRLGLTPSR
jgi:hypothetical protein